VPWWQGETANFRQTSELYETTQGSRRYWFLVLCGVVAAGRVMGQGTAFTYQGQLNGSGGPATGRYDFAFTLYTTNVTGTPVAGPVTYAATGVTNGLFTTLVDFGPGVFTGTSKLAGDRGKDKCDGEFCDAGSPAAAHADAVCAGGGSVTGLTVQENAAGTPNLIGGAANNTVGNGWRGRRSPAGRRTASDRVPPTPFSAGERQLGV